MTSRVCSTWRSEDQGVWIPRGEGHRMPPKHTKHITVMLRKRLPACTICTTHEYVPMIAVQETNHCHACSHLLGNISRLSLEVFEGLHHGVVVQDGALHGTDRVQKTFLQLTELPGQETTNNKKGVTPLRRAASCLVHYNRKQLGYVDSSTSTFLL